MKNFLDRIKENSPLVSDGAMGTMLMERGLKSGNCPEEINLTRPEILEEISTLYLNAGAEILHTNTFGGSPLKLASYSLDNKTEKINISAVNAVKKVSNGKAYASASCGPSGKILKPFGDTSSEELMDSFIRQMEAFKKAEPDIICIETMTDLTEIKIAIEAARSSAPGIPVMATMTFDPTPRGFFTIMGVTIEKAAEELEKAGADVIGSNCGNGIENMIEIARKFKKHTELPLIIQSNAGMPEMKDGKPFYGETPTFMAEKARILAGEGAKIIGGCCGTTPDHIKAIKKAIF